MGLAYVCLYLSYLEALEPFTMEERGRLLTGMMLYQKTGEIPAFSGNERYLFPSLKAQIDRDNASYETRCAKLRSNGAKGGRPVGVKNQKVLTETKRFSEEPVGCKENEKVKEKEKEKGNAFEIFAGNDDALKTALGEFERMRKALKKPLTDHARELVCKQLERDFDRADWIAVLEQSVRNSWQGLFPLKDVAGRVQLAADRSHDLDDVL